MPGLMSRLSLIFKAKFSKALDRAENPNETLDYSYEQQLQQLQDIMTQGQQLEAQQQKLVEGERTLQAKVEQFRTQKEVIKAQYSAAEAQVRIGEAATGIGEQMADVGLAIERAKDKTQQMQARANAIDELTAAGSLEDFTGGGDD